MIKLNDTDLEVVSGGCPTIITLPVALPGAGPFGTPLLNGTFTHPIFVIECDDEEGDWV